MFLLFLFFLLISQHYTETSISGCHGDRDKDHLLRVSCMSQGLAAVPDGIDGETQVLVFSQNIFVSLSWIAYSTFPHLQELDLSQNLIRTIGPSGPVLKHLRVLRLSENKLTSLARDTFHSTPSLMELYLDRNSISSLDTGTFSGLLILELINLSRNMLHLLPTHLLQNISSNLKNFDLEHNRIQHLPDHFFAAKPDIPYVFLSRNLWTCSCQVRYLQQYLEEQAHNIYTHTGASSIENDPESVVCSAPLTLLGRAIMDLKEEDYCTSHTEPQHNKTHTPPTPALTSTTIIFQTTSVKTLHPPMTPTFIPTTPPYPTVQSSPALFLLTPASTNPASTNPATTNPATTNPATTNPATTNPATINPATTNPATTNLATTNPATINPATTNPATINPATTNPATINPATTNPATINPATTNPATINPATTNPATTNPATTNPATINPAITNPATINPAITNPATINPATTNPATINPAITNPATINPAITNPATINPAITNPATINPATINPATTNPATIYPATTNPATINPTTTTRTTPPTATTRTAPVQNTVTEMVDRVTQTVRELGSAHAGSVIWCWWLFVTVLLLSVCSAFFSCMLLVWLLITYITLYRPIKREVCGGHQVTLRAYRVTADESPALSEKKIVQFLAADLIRETQPVFRSVLFISKGATDEDAEPRNAGVTDEEERTRGSDAAVTLQKEQTESKQVFRKTFYRLISREEEIEGWKEVQENYWKVTEREKERRKEEWQRMNTRYSLILREERGSVREGRKGEAEWLVGEWEMSGGNFH